MKTSETNISISQTLTAGSLWV